MWWRISEPSSINRTWIQFTCLFLGWCDKAFSVGQFFFASEFAVLLCLPSLWDLDSIILPDVEVGTGQRQCNSCMCFWSRRHQEGGLWTMPARPPQSLSFHTMPPSAHVREAQSGLGLYNCFKTSVVKTYSQTQSPSTLASVHVQTPCSGSEQYGCFIKYTCKHLHLQG